MKDLFTKATLLAACLLAVRIATPLAAQTPLRVLRYTPADSGSPGSLITVTFDRPVAGMLGSSIDASKVMSIRPAVPGLFEWRDPITLRFVPTEPFTPGTRVTVAVDTAAIAAAIATGGARTGKPYEFSVRFPGPTPLVQTIDGTPSGYNSVGPRPIFRVLYSAPVNLDSIDAASRVVFSDSCGGVVRLKAVRQRKYTSDDHSQFFFSGPFSRDSLQDSFMRVVELEAERDLPPGCVGKWVVVPFDPARPNEMWRYSIKTNPVFKVLRVLPDRQCPWSLEFPCSVEALSIEFSAPIKKADAARLFRTTPEMKTDTELWRGSVDQTAMVTYVERLVPRQQYTITIAEGLRDIFGRPLQGPTSFTVTAHDRAPGVKQQSGLVTLTSDGKRPAVVSIRTLNVDTLIMHAMPIPDSLVALLVATSDDDRYKIAARIRAALRDTIHVLVPVHGVFNTEGNVDVDIPAALTGEGATPLFAVRFEIKAPSVPPDSVQAYKLRRAEEERARLRISQRMPQPYSEYRLLDLGLIVQVSPLVAHVKAAGEQGAVFVTNRAGAVIPGASVELRGDRNELLASGTTNKDGLALLAPVRRTRDIVTDSVKRGPPPQSVRYVTVHHGNDRLVVPAEGAIATTLPIRTDAGALGARRASPLQWHATITPERNLYRPGEKLFMKVFARTGLMGLTLPPAGDSVRVTAVRGDYYYDGFGVLNNNDAGGIDTIGVLRAKLSRFGTAADSLQIPQNARLGNYLLLAEARIDETWRVVAQTNVRVEEFRAPEFLVSVIGDTALRYVGDTVVAKLSAQYLFGAPMAGAKVVWAANSFVADGSSRVIPNTKGFSIGRVSWWEDQPGAEVVYFRAVDSLDKNGTLNVRIPTVRGSLSRPSVLSIQLAVSDLNNQSVTTSTAAFLQGSSLYVAMKDRNTSWYWKPGAKQTLDVFTVRANGERVVDVPLRVTIVQRRYAPDTSRTPTGSRRWLVDTILRSTLLSKREPVPVAFTPVRDGAYDVRVEATDEQGRDAVTNIGKWVYREPWYARPRGTSLQLKVATQHANNEQFSLGDAARVTFESPFASADAWVTIEREGVLEQQRLVVPKGTTTIAVPVTARLAPNAWVGVTLIKRGTAPLIGADSVAPLMRVGYVELRVDSTAHQLHVQVVPQAATVVPGDSVQVQINVRDASAGAQNRGIESEVALWAVDEGVLSMTGFKTPDILHAIDAQLGVAQNLRSTFATLPWLQPTGEVRPGVNVRRVFDGARLAAMAMMMSSSVSQGATVNVQAAAIGLRSDFRFTAFYIGTAHTSTDGVATLRAKLPDNITTYRLMATAVGTGNRYGSSDAPLLATRRVVLRASLPRFVRAGDSLMASALLNVREGDASPMRVTSSITNAVMRGDSVQAFAVNPGKGNSVRFPVFIPEKTTADATRVVFRAVDSARGDGDAVATTIPIRPTGTPRAHTTIGMVRDTGSISMMLPAGIDPLRSSVSIALGTSPVVALRSHYARLRAYYYYSTDVIVASARALLTVSNAERLLNERIVTRDSETVLMDLQTAANQLVSRQTGNGEFTYWQGGGTTIGAGLTAYVGTFLLEAQKAGVSIPPSTFARISMKLKSDLTTRIIDSDTADGSPLQRQRGLRQYLAWKLAVVQYLRRAGTPAPAVEDSLVLLAPRMSWEDRVLLVDVMAERPELRDRAVTMHTSLWTSVSVLGKRLDIPDSLFGSGAFPSHIRPAARLLAVTTRLSPNNALIGALSETILLQDAANNGWRWNVHDHAAAIEAIAGFISAQRGNPADRVVARSAGGREVFSQLTGSAGTAGLGGDSLQHTLAGLITSNGDGTSQLKLSLSIEQSAGDSKVTRSSPLYYAVTVTEVPLVRPVTPDIAGIVVERWYERFDDGTPTVEAHEGELVRVRLRVTVSSDRQFVAMEDMLPAGLEAVDLSFRTSAALGPFATPIAPNFLGRQRDMRPEPNAANFRYGSWDSGWWSPWEFKEMRDDRVFFFSRQLWSGTYNSSYIARATTTGTFVRPPAHAEEMYNPAVQGRSDGGVFVVRPSGN